MLIWRVGMYMGEHNLHATRPIGECFQRLVSDPANGIITAVCGVGFAALFVF